ncbi:MAG: class I SAM-dependent RNA methyltransferase [Deltaproteobacteria bacterium]|nr:class I SAM-dependent RNA methyltransferase [Deltaproteobacteria bacterium]
MQINDRVTIRIESIAFGGEGVGRIDNFVVFVPFSASGDELEIEIIQLKKKFVRGRILKIIKPSPARVKPLCRYYWKCGGCCYQHLNYEYQLTIKKRQVEEAFGRIGKIAHPPVSDVIASPGIYNYRGKAQYHAKFMSNDWEIGFLDIFGGELVNIEHCEIMEETINEKMRVLRENNRLKSNKDAQLTIWSGCLPGEPCEKESIIRMVKGKIFHVPREGFFQANLYLTDKLVDEVCRLAATDRINTLIDAYCGSGLFSVFLSSCAENVIGIEINEKSVNYARVNAENAGVKNAKFIQGDIENVLKGRFLPPGSKIDLIVLDPPRTGCEKTVLKAMVDLQPQKIIYVSCNPATQARDVKYLNECGYNLQSLLPVDMFPQTEHIEVIGFIERR